MFREVAPRLWYNVGRMVKPYHCNGVARYVQNSGVSPSLHSHRSMSSNPWCRSRGNVPIMRRSALDDFSGRWFPFTRIEQQVKNMQRLMDEVTPRGWGRPYEFVRTAGAKQVQVKYTNKEFEVKIDVGEYEPEELNVKIAGDKLSVSAKHEEKPDEHGFISREFTRQFLIPEDVEMESIESQLMTDGYLVVRGTVKGAEEAPERVINIQKEQPKTDSKYEKKDKEG